MKKLVLAYSGGLDTSYCLKTLSQEGYEVHAVSVNTGGFSAEEIKAQEEKAYAMGASTYRSIDALQSFYDKIVKYLIFGNVLKNNTYPLSVSAERIVQAIEIIEYAKSIDAQYIAHGSTGAGNDHVRFDLIFQRIIEIWSSLPMLFVIIIISSILKPSFFLLIGIYTMVNWIGMTYLMRAEFYREKSKPYVAAALSMGQSNFKIMFKHILANSLVPIITYFPFSVVAGISALVGLDYLGFGLAPPTPSWGQMLDVGLQNIRKWWMVFSPVTAQFLTLLSIVFIGEGVREAFDPKVYSRLR